ncbi:MAG: hypothetical protein WCB49_10130 [Gammaproteobacteria bacterium]
MTALTIIALASGLTLAPIHATAQSTTARYQQAQQTLDNLTATAEPHLHARAADRALNQGLAAFKTGFARRMEVHAREQLVADRSSAATQPDQTHRHRARQRLDRLTAEAETGLHARAVDRALNQGLAAFKTGFARRMEVHAREQLAANRRLAAARSWVIK